MNEEYGKRPEDIEELKRFLKDQDWLDSRGRNLVMHAVRQYVKHTERFTRPWIVPANKPEGPPTRHIHEGQQPPYK